MEETQQNITQTIKETLNSIFSDLLSSIDNNLYSVLDEITFINIDVINDHYFQNIFGSTSSGILLISNALIIGIVIYYAISLLMSYYSYTEVQKPSQFFFRMLIFTIIMNSSYFICEQIISMNSNISIAVRQVGESILGKEICFNSLITELNKVIDIQGSSFNIFSTDGLLKSFISIGLLNLTFNYALRYIMLKVFILICPFAILCLINKNTIWFFKSWLRIMLSLLLIQILISLILLIIFSINYSNNIFSKLLYIGGIYALTKANQFMRDFIGGISTEINSNFSNLRFFLGGK